MEPVHSSTDAVLQCSGASLWVPGDFPVVMKKYMCVICGFIYDEEMGLPDHGIAAGTRWADVPLNWRCPDCGASKEDFEMIEI